MKQSKRLLAVYVAGSLVFASAVGGQILGSEAELVTSGDRLQDVVERDRFRAEV
jgi:hypothetical protein